MKGFNLFTILFLSLLLFSCESDVKFGDFSNIMVQVAIENKKGQNLLDPEVEGNILETPMYIFFNDERYNVEQGWPDIPPYDQDGKVSTRMLMPDWYGAFIAPTNSWYIKPENPYNNYIFIGEFNGATDGTTTIQLFVLNKVYEVSFINKTKKHFQNQQTFYLDGKKQEGDIIKIII